MQACCFMISKYEQNLQVKEYNRIRSNCNEKNGFISETKIQLYKFFKAFYQRRVQVDCILHQI